MSIAKNIEEVKARLSAAARRSGHDPAGIKLIAVTKHVSPELICQALAAGLTDLGENRVQEAAQKIALVKQKYPDSQWHMIGHLQRNKVGQALDIFDIIHSVDSERLAGEIDRRAVRLIPILIEVNTSGETSKYGVEIDRAVELVQKVASLKNLTVVGLMTLGPLTADPERSRASFKKLGDLKKRLNQIAIPKVEMQYLSMGMSSDFEVAVEEGANLVRLGQAIFGRRR